MFDVDEKIIYLCPDCKEKSSGWTNTSVGCEDCGEHPAAKCPLCYNIFDLIFIELEVYGD